MKHILITTIICISSLITQGQTSLCDSLLNNKPDNREIVDTNAFCKGVELALEHKGLAIRSIGDPHQSNQCVFHSYEEYGVELIMTGDIVLSHQLDENDGFNAVMIPKVKDSLGENFNKLGVISSEWNDIDLKSLMNEFVSCFESFKILSDSTVYCKLDSLRVSKSIFKSLEGVVFYDINKNLYDLEDLFSGVTFALRGTQRLIIITDFSDYPNPNKICEARGRFMVPINLSE